MILFVYGIPDLIPAYRVKQLRAGRVMHSWRRIAEIYCDEFPYLAKKFLRGNQIYGMDLCRDAAERLGVTRDEYDKEWE